MLTNIDQLDLSKRYTYQDYLTWKFDGMVELIRGQVFKMSPAPSRVHQKISGKLFQQIINYLEDKSCEVYSAPFDVRLPLPLKQQTNDKIDTVVQPDICVICDVSKLDDKGCIGAPDWVIEILSKGTASKDLTQKFDLYQHAGVREYWIVHTDGTIMPYVLDENGQYQLIRKTPFVLNEQVPVAIFPNLGISLEKVFTGFDAL